MNLGDNFLSLAWERLIDIASLTGTIIGIITLIQANRIKEELKIQKMQSLFVNKAPMFKNAFNTYLIQFNNHSVATNQLPEILKDLSILKQISLDCNWDSEKVNLIDRCIHSIQNYKTILDDGGSDLSKENDIAQMLIEIHTIIIREESIR